MALSHVKANHNGAKHGKGAWTTKAAAKMASRKIRRTDDRRFVREALKEGK